MPVLFQDGSGIKRTMSDLERAIQISKQEFSAGDKSIDKPAPEPPGIIMEGICDSE